MKRGILYLSFALLMVIGCGSQSTSVKQETSTPTGSIQGQVVDFGTNAGLSGATVSTTAGSGLASVKSDTTGIYQLTGLPTGTYYPVYFSLPGYGTSIYGTDLGNTPPAFPQGNALSIVDAYLYKADGTVKGTVYDSSGNPFTQTANVMIDMRDLTGNRTGFIGINGVFRATTSPADGGYTLANLPAAFDCSLQAPIIAWYVDQSGTYYAGQNTVNLCSGGTSFAPDITLVCNLPRPDIVSTTQDVSADNPTVSTLSLHVGVFYDQPMDPTPGMEPTITPGCGATEAGFMWTGTTAGEFTITVNPSTNCSGRNYAVFGAQNVCGRAQNAYNGTFN